MSDSRSNTSRLTAKAIRSATKLSPETYILDINNLEITSTTVKKYFCSSTSPLHIDFQDVKDVRKGWNTDSFNRKMFTSSGQPVVNGHSENRCFSIIFGPQQKTLDLVADDEAIQNQWVTKLNGIVSRYKSQNYKERHMNSLRKKFKKVDKDNTGNLKFHECLKLLSELNIEMNEKHARKLFMEANKRKTQSGKNEVLDMDEFITFYKSLINRPELRELMQKFGEGNDEFLTANQLLAFLQQEQKMTTITLRDCEILINAHETRHEQDMEHKTILSLNGFRSLLLSPQQNIFNNDHSGRVYQDMKQPMHNYYIASSHNTYLVGNQLTGESSIEGYITALERGCRCVEMDLWDGDDGEPIVYHGYTLVSKLSFKDILMDAIKPYAFKKSQYPLILSLENHCSVEQQEKIATYLRTILGDMLYVCPIFPKDMDKLPSPEHLRGKVIIKAKKLPETVETNEEDNDAEDSESEPEDENDNGTKPKAPKAPVSKELSNLVAICRSVHFKAFETNTAKDKFHDIVSISESKANNLIEENPQAFVKYTADHLVRLYPKGTRVGSTNYDPIPMWNVGCQIVALNYQSNDKQNGFNDAKFLTNGNCGYVLKPQFLIDGSFDPTNPGDKYSKKVYLEIISGQYLPKPHETEQGDIVDPFVVVKVRGHKTDKQKFRTKTIKNNGFNPLWKEKFEIPLTVPELAFLHFIVYDDDVGTDDKLGQCIVPFISLEQGYRHVNLVNKHRESIAPATLFVHVAIAP